MYTRWRLYILGVFIAIIVIMIVGIRLLKKRGVQISFLQSLFFILGIVLIVESIIIMRLSNFNLGVILPAFFGVPLVFLAVYLPYMQNGFLAFFKWFIAGCYAVAACIFIICSILMVSAQHSAKNFKTDAVIVLGAAVHGTRVSWVLENRLNTAITVLEHNPDAICIVSGGQGPQEDCTEASAMRLYLIEHGIDEGRIYLEEQATNTIDNFVYSKPIVEDVLSPDARLSFVTTDFHVYRASRVARSQGVSAVGIAAPDVWYLRLNNFLRECVGICIYSLRGEFA